MLVVGYVGVVVLGLSTTVQPRVFWTMLLPLLPISIVLMGFANWRRVCPLAFWGELGRRANSGEARRVPKWFESWFFLVTFGFLLTMLAFRLVATNGDGLWLSGLLVALGLAAFLVNRFFTGKTWCNFFCPVGFVERVYTEPRSLPDTPSSQCGRCTACKSGCPDIDPENAYWRDVTSTARRVATYSFPGLVLGFYTYYWLRAGEWEAYFDGRWTRVPVDTELVLGSGFFFAPGVPAVVAAPLSLLLFAAASYLLFLGIEAVASRFVEDQERRRHLVLTVAAFSAFATFYVFAGAPTLRRIPAGTRAMAFASPLLATLFLVKRWGRHREAYIREKAAAKILKRWPFDEPPPDDPREVYGWIKAGEHAREKNVEAYEVTVREILSDGLVTRDEMNLLESVQSQLGVSKREHEQVMARLSEEERDLFEGAHGGVEARESRLDYEDALASALLRHASADELEELRLSFGVTLPSHEASLAKVRSASGALVERAEYQLERVEALGDELAALVPHTSDEAGAFLASLVRRERDQTLETLFDVLEVLGRADRIRGLRSGVVSEDAAVSAEALEQLADAVGSAADLVPRLASALGAPGAPDDPAALRRLIERRADSVDHYVRAAAVWVASALDEPWAREVVDAARSDSQRLVAEVATRAPGPPPERFSERTGVERMQALRNVALFAELDPEDLHDLVGMVEEETVLAPEPLCVEGDVDADDLFILVEGEASVLVDVEGVGEREVAVLGPGEVVGEMSILDGSPRSATVRPREEAVRVLRIPGQPFRNRLLPRSRVSRPLLVTLTRRIRDMSRRV